jgi:glutathione peroxidase
MAEYFGVSQEKIMFRQLLAVAVGLILMTQTTLFAAEDSKDVPPVLKFKTKSLEGKDVDLSKYQGKVLLIVNTASRCGYTPQYKGLESLHEKYSKDGLVVLGFPCNQFFGQEPGSPEQIRDFCTSKYNVKFDLLEKVDVKGPHQTPLYKWLTSAEGTPSDPGDVKWNFEKFLVGKDGKVVARFRTKIDPESPQVAQAIESELKK